MKSYATEALLSDEEVIKRTREYRPKIALKETNISKTLPYLLGLYHESTFDTFFPSESNAWFALRFHAYKYSLRYLCLYGDNS